MVTFADFVVNVKKEVAFCQQGTPWNRRVASLSAFILHESPFRTVNYYDDKNAVVALVRDLTPNLNDDALVEDVGQFLSNIAKDLILKSGGDGCSSGSECNRRR